MRRAESRAARAERRTEPSGAPSRAARRALSGTPSRAARRVRRRIKPSGALSRAARRAESRAAPRAGRSTEPSGAPSRAARPSCRLVGCRCLEMARFYVRRCRVRRLLRTYTSDGAFENTHRIALTELSRSIVWHHFHMSPQGYKCVPPPPPLANGADAAGTTFFVWTSTRGQRARLSRIFHRTWVRS